MEHEKYPPDRKTVLDALAKRFEKKGLSERKNKDGTLVYQEFLDHMERRKNAVISVRYIIPPTK